MSQTFDNFEDFFKEAQKLFITNPMKVSPLPCWLLSLTMLESVHAHSPLCHYSFYSPPPLDAVLCKVPTWWSEDPSQVHGWCDGKCLCSSLGSPVFGSFDRDWHHLQHPLVYFCVSSFLFLVSLFLCSIFSSRRRTKQMWRRLMNLILSWSRYEVVKELYRFTSPFLTVTLFFFVTRIMGASACTLPLISFILPLLRPLICLHTPLLLLVYHSL